MKLLRTYHIYHLIFHFDHHHRLIDPSRYQYTCQTDLPPLWWWRSLVVRWVNWLFRCVTGSNVSRTHKRTAPPSRLRCGRPTRRHIKRRVEELCTTYYTTTGQMAGKKKTNTSGTKVSRHIVSDRRRDTLTRYLRIRLEHRQRYVVNQDIINTLTDVFDPW